MPRGLKRFIIIIIYLILFGLIGWGLVKLAMPAPTCFDGIKNQNELKVDCGGVCPECPSDYKPADLTVLEKVWVPAGEGKYDLMVRVANPNINEGSARFDYQFKLLDSGGAVLAERSGRSYILPKETKYIIEPGVAAGAAPASLAFSVADYHWEIFSDYQAPKIPVYNQAFHLRSQNLLGSDAYGLVVNESPYDFSIIKIGVVLRDSFGKVIGLGVSEIRTVYSGERRDFFITWGEGMIAEEAAKIEMKAESNVLDEANLIKR